MRKTYDILKTLRERAGFKTKKSFATALGYKQISSYQRYESEEFSDKKYTAKFIDRIFPVLIGKGEPSITKDDVFDICEPSFIRNNVANIATESTPDNIIKYPTDDLPGELKRYQGIVKSVIKTLHEHDHEMEPDELIACIDQIYKWDIGDRANAKDADIVDFTRYKNFILKGII